jgi:multidrug resistance efflux pump
MIRKYVLPLLAAAGLALAIWVVVQGSRPVPAAQPVAQPAPSGYESSISGAGIVEASTENVAIGTGVGGVVTDVYVEIGQDVVEGAPLFRVRDRTPRAELEMHKAAARTAKAQLEKLQAYVREEDVAVARAKLSEAEAVLGDAQNQLELYESVPDRRAIVEQEMTRRRFAAKTAAARVEQALADLKRLEGGPWLPDLEVAKAELAAAEAQVAVTEADIDRHTIKAPMAGKILQVKVREGEYAPAGVLATPLMVLGATDTLHVRVDIDENDAWKLVPNAPAKAHVRGNPERFTELKFVRVEPYVVPKRSLTGESSERVDTRVLQVVYSFPRDALAVYVGQQMDVSVEVPKRATDGPAATSVSSTQPTTAQSATAEHTAAQQDAGEDK